MACLVDLLKKLLEAGYSNKKEDFELVLIKNELQFLKQISINHRYTYLIAVYIHEKGLIVVYILRKDIAGEL